MWELASIAICSSRAKPRNSLSWAPKRPTLASLLPLWLSVTTCLRTDQFLQGI